MYILKAGEGCVLKMRLVEANGAPIELRNARFVQAILHLPNEATMLCEDVRFDEVSQLVFVRLSAKSELTMEGVYGININALFDGRRVVTSAVLDFAEVKANAESRYYELLIDLIVSTTDVPSCVKYTGASPKISENGTWLVFNDEINAFEDTGISIFGKSAYQAAIESGIFSGTEDDFNAYMGSISQVTNDAILATESANKATENANKAGAEAVRIATESANKATTAKENAEQAAEQAIGATASANEAAQRANEEVQKIKEKADTDGYYPDMSVGMADNAAVANELDCTISLIGKGMTSVTRKLHLVKGRAYRLSCVTPNWDLPTTSNTGWYKFIFRRWQGDTSQSLLYVKHTEDFPASFTYIASEDADYYDIYLRASDGVEVKFLLEPIEINVENVAFVAGWGGNPTINHTTKTLDLGSEAVFKIGTEYYSSTRLACDTHNIPLQDTSGSSVQFLYFNTQEETIFPKIYTYKPKAEEVLLGGIKFLSDGTIIPNLIFDVEYTGKGSENGIVQLNGEAETLLKLRQLNRQSRDINGNLVGVKPLSLLHFSDIHSREDNLQRIMDFANYYDTYIDDVVYGGDVVGGHWGNDFTFWENCGANKVLSCIGNHDVAHYSEEEGWDYYRYVGIDAYNRYFAPYISEWGVTQPSDAASAGKCYYYKDYVDSQVRLIVLDCMAIANGDKEQLTWLTSTLESAKQSGLTVAIVNHYTTIHNKIECAFTNLFTDTLPTDINSGLIDIVGNYTDSGGKFAAWITGHAHRDWFGTVKGATGKNQTVVCVDTAAARVQSIFSDIERNESDKSFDLFNIIGIDTYRHRISVFRIGADFDAAQRHIGSICYDYENHNLLANW